MATIEDLAAEAASCTNCPLYENATQAVFGEGKEGAQVMLVGEQPGDQEDRKGRPFVGPAGRILDRALEEGGIDRSTVYVTNAVKHFKWKPLGPRRLHQKPNTREMAACKPWLEAEIEAVGPEVIVALGATAAQSLLGPQIRITRDRGSFFDGPSGIPVLVTTHPSAILRGEEDQREAELARLVADLSLVNERLAAG